MLAGSPGAGKGVVRSQLLAEEAQRFTVVDPDEFKVLLIRAAVEDGSIESMMPPEAAARGVRLAPMELAALVHEESSYLAHRFRERAIARGENVVIDGVMANEGKVLGLASQLAGAGYDIRVVDVEVPAQLSRERILQRWVEQTVSGGLGGRWVPSEYRESVFDCPDGTRSRSDIAARSVAERNDAVSSYERYFTTVQEARQPGCVPRLTDRLRRDASGQLRAEPLPAVSAQSLAQSSRPSVQQVPSQAGASRPSVGRADTDTARGPVRERGRGTDGRSATRRYLSGEIGRRLGQRPNRPEDGGAPYRARGPR